MAKRLRVAINGFGRIGRNVLRAYIERGGASDLDIVAINDIADHNTLLHLLKFDSAHGRLKTPVAVKHDRFDGSQPKLCVHLPERTETIGLFSASNPNQLPWQSHNVDLVLECTGQFRAYADAQVHLHAGAKRVIIGAAPFDDVDACVVYGVNHLHLKDEQVISSVSCTTQALVPLIKVLDDAFGVDSAMMTEVHAVTADQNVLDQAHRDLRRARACGQNIIPTTSSSLAALQQVLPHMSGRVDGMSIRVPTIDVAAVDVTANLNHAVTVDQLNALFQKKSQEQFAGIMQVSDEPLVSSDYIHDAHSLTIDLEQTKVLKERQVKVFAWYDNEWGYANRLVDLCLYLASRSRM